MKKIFTLLALTITFSMNAQWSYNSNVQGSGIQSSTNTASGEYSTAMGAVNYQGLVPVLINALKEQDKIIKSQEARLTNIENLLAKLNE